MIVRNKVRLVAKRYTQEFEIDFEESYALVAIIETIKILLAYACHKWIKLFQMDVKSAFLNSYIKEEVYVEQPPEFEDTKWIFRNKLSDTSVIVWNKSRLVTKGYTQEFEIDFEKSYVLVARMEAIRILLAYACHKWIKLFQIDINSAFLNGFIK